MLKPLSLLAALTCALALSAPALAAVSTPPEIKISEGPWARSQYPHPRAFFEAQAKAIQSAGSSVSEDFIKQWFGARAVKEGRSAALDATDAAGPYTMEFVKDGTLWRKTRENASERKDKEDGERKRAKRFAR